MIYQSDNDKLKNVLFIFQNYSIKTSAGTQMFCTLQSPPLASGFSKEVISRTQLLWVSWMGKNGMVGESGEVEVEEGETSDSHKIISLQIHKHK